jgi:hypothetical protein
MATQKRPLPKLADLHKDPNLAFKSDELNYLLNQPPNNLWVKNHPTATVKNDKGENVKAKYIPIDKVEFLLTFIFQEWRVEVLSSCVMLNSICVTIRLHYKNPVTGEWLFHDGVGAKDVQLDAGSMASDLTKIKAAAVMMALPSAKSYAIKDAAEHLGPLFGRDLNRKNVIEFTGAYSEHVPPANNEQKEQPGNNENPGSAKKVEFVL